MNYDLILEEIGEFGPFQIRNYFLTCLPVLFGTLNAISYVFIAASPSYRCVVPECDSRPPKFDETWVPDAVPGRPSKTSGFIPETCLRFVRNTSVASDDSCSAQIFTSDMEKCDEWVFDEQERTIVNDMKIKCRQNEWKLALVGTLSFAGVIVGSAMAGFLADKFGRKRVLVIAIMEMASTGVALACTRQYELFAFLKFLNSIGTAAIFPTVFILGVESVGKRKREMAGTVPNFFDTTGGAALGLIAWLTRDWVKTQLIISVPAFVFISYIWLVPESVRWLIAKRRFSEAEEIVLRAARVNGVKLSKNLYDLASISVVHEKVTEQSALLQTKMESSHKASDDIASTYAQILRSKVLVIRGLVMYFDWAVVAFVFYGLSLNSVNLVGNKYLNFSLMILAEVPGNAVAWFCMNRFGRRRSLALSLALCGSVCIATALPFIEFPLVILGFSLAGKICITCSFAILFVYSAEMLPTTVRSGGVGSMSTFGRIATLVGPFVPLLSKFHKSIPMLLFGLVSIVGGSLVTFLPETLGLQLPDTVEEAVNMGRNTV